MIIVTFVVQLFGATMLLLFAVRMVRTGIERAFGAALERLVTSGRSPLHLAPVGMVLAILLQSSAAVTLLVAGFAGGGVIGFAPAVALVLGGDLGSAVIIQVLSLKLDWLAPVLLAAGGTLFLKTQRRALRYAGRITLGIALILLSLELLRGAVDPIRDSGFLPAIADYLERDFLTAFIAGAALAFVMHSSVAAILMCVTVVAIGALPVSVGLSLVLGANLGSALIPVWLSRDFAPEARRIPAANLIIRGTAALVALFGFNAAAAPVAILSTYGAQGLVMLHIAFNAALLLFIPIVAFLERPMQALMPAGPAGTADADTPDFRSVLPDTVPETGSEALANLRREVLRMTDIVSDMFDPVMELYARADTERTHSIQARDEAVNAALDGVRKYMAELSSEMLNRSERRELRALVDYAIALEAAGDIIVKRLLILAEEMHDAGQSFSTEGREELEHLHRKVARNLKTAANVLISGDLDGARRLLQEKADMARLERKSRKRHLKRLSQGKINSMSTSDKHLETAYLMKELHSWVISVAHPILAREGQLLESRLVEAGQPGSEG